MASPLLRPFVIDFPVWLWQIPRKGFDLVFGFISAWSGETLLDPAGICCNEWRDQYIHRIPSISIIISISTLHLVVRLAVPKRFDNISLFASNVLNICRNTVWIELAKQCFECDVSNIETTTTVWFRWKELFWIISCSCIYIPECFTVIFTECFTEG